MELNLAGVEEESYVDGSGIRYVVFVQGCPHHCDECHNPQTWEFKQNIIVDIDEIIAKMKENILLDGITFSGGEPFTQAKALCELAKKAKINKYNVWCFTGFTYEQLLNSNNEDYLNLLHQVDFLVDGRYDKDKRDMTLQFRGSRNQRIINVPASLSNHNIILGDFY